jgi:hypothetical protein
MSVNLSLRGTPHQLPKKSNYPVSRPIAQVYGRSPAILQTIYPVTLVWLTARVELLAVYPQNLYH